MKRIIQTVCLVALLALVPTLLFAQDELTLESVNEKLTAVVDDVDVLNTIVSILSKKYDTIGEIDDRLSAIETRTAPTLTPEPTPTTQNTLSSRGTFGDTPLHEAVESGNADLVRLLVEGGADVDATGSFGDTPLHVAVDGSYVEIVRILVEGGADVNKPGSFDNTPLHEAVERGHAEIVRILVEGGGDINKPGFMSDTPLTLALDNTDVEIVEILLGAPSENEDESTPEPTAEPDNTSSRSRSNDQDAAAMLLANGIAMAEQGRWEDAIGYFGDVIQLRPDAPRAYFERGQAYLELERYEEAIADFDAAILRQPDEDSAAYNNRGSAKLLLSVSRNEDGTPAYDHKLVEDALLDFDNAIRIRSDLPGPFFNRGAAKKILGYELDSVRADLETALQLAQESEEQELIEEIQTALELLSTERSD